MISSNNLILSNSPFIGLKCIVHYSFHPDGAKSCFPGFFLKIFSRQLSSIQETRQTPLNSEF